MPDAPSSDRQNQPCHQNFSIEALEPRLLLTAAMGGDSFQFVDVDGQVVQVDLQGDILAELIGAKTDGTGIFLGDLGGTFVGSDVGKTGVEINLDALELISGTGITDNLTDGNSLPFSAGGRADINLQSLATNSVGVTYTFNLTSVDIMGTNTPIVQLIRLDTSGADNNAGTVVAHLEGVLPTAGMAGLSTVTAIRAAAFDPTDPDMLYFVVESGMNGLEQLYRLDISAADISASVEQAAGQFNETMATGDRYDVHDIAFDQTGPGDVRLFALIEESAGSFITQLQFDNGDLTSPATDTNVFINPINVTFAGGRLDNLTGLVLLGDDPGAADNDFLLTEAEGSDSQLYTVSFLDGFAFSLGLSEDTDDTASPFRGEDLQDLTFDPTMLDPFTGELGAFLAVDATSDEVVYVSIVERGFNQLFNIYIAHAGEGASISVSTVNVTAMGETLTPYSGVSALTNGTNVTQATDTAQFGLDIFNTTDGIATTVLFEEAIGGVYIGAKQFVAPMGGGGAQPVRPVVSASLADRLGMYATGVDTAPDVDTDNVTAGIIVSPSLLSFFSNEEEIVDRLIGNNIDQTDGLAVKRDITDSDSIVVIDTDGINVFGSAVGDQLAVIDPLTGKATTIVSVLDGITPLSGVLAMAFGDPTFSSAETLYAVYDIGGTLTLGTIDTGSGAFTAVAALDPTLQAVGVRSMAFAPTVSTNTAAPQQAMFIVGEDNAIYEVSADGADAGDVVAGGDDIDGNPVEVDSIFFNRFGTQLLAHDVENARIVDIDLSTLGSGVVVAGGAVATVDGSVRPSLGGVAYDFTNDRYLAVDNATGDLFLGDAEDVAEESAALMVIKNITGLSSNDEINNAQDGQDIDNVLIGGKITGRVDIHGTVHGTFYGGAMLTGASAGQFDFSPPTFPANFYVDGDLQSLVSGSSFGTNTDVDTANPIYYTGFDLMVGGRAQQIWALNSFAGTFDIVNSGAMEGGATSIQEIEGRFDVADEWLGLNGYGRARLTDGTDRFFNDTFDTAQTVGSLRNPVAGEPAFTRIEGVLDAFLTTGDVVDYYSLALMAGQTIEVQLDPLATPFALNVGVFDPDGRLIATNLNAVDSTVTTFEPFRITTDRPGEYRIAVTTTGTAFDNTGLLTGGNPYALQIESVGELALGGLRATNDIYSGTFGEVSYQVDRGDLGAIRGGGSLWFATGSIAGLTEPDVLVNDGNLRAMIAGENIASSTFLLSGPAVEVRGGGIGLLHNDGTFMHVDTGSLDGDPDDAPALVDGYIQVIDAAGEYEGYTFSNMGVGVVRAGSISNTLGATYFRVNADNLGNDGMIDLIDVGANFGNIASGGPGIKTGDGGNVRYMRIGGTIFQDALFLGGGYAERTLEIGESYRHVDDSGGVFNITPASAPNPNFDPTLPVSDTNPLLIGGELTIQQYAIRGSGGSVLVNLAVSDFSVTFSGENGAGNHPVEVSRIEMLGSGQAVVEDVNGNIGMDTSTTTIVNILFDGNRPIDVFDIIGSQINVIENQTGGEIVSVTAQSVGAIRTYGRLGVPKTHSGALVNASTVINDVYPFSLQSTGINIAGNVVFIEAREGLGNLMIGGSVAEIHANVDHSNSSGGFEGVLAPVYVANNLNLINVGEGVAPTGSGYASWSGVYVENALGVVENQSGGNLYGDIVSTLSIDEIILHDGSLINMQVATYGTLEMASVAGPAQSLVNNPDIIEIGLIELNGTGGIIGSLINGGDMGDIDVRNGFGIFDSIILNVGNSEIGDVSADGYGILGTEIQAAASMGDLTANGRGDVLAVGAFSEAIRLSGLGFEYDPMFNTRLTRLTDLSLAFAATPTYQMAAGQINAVTANGVVDLGDVQAYRIIDTSLNFGNSIKSIRTDRSADADPTTIDGLTVTTGDLRKLQPGADVSRLDLTVAGYINSINLRGNLLGDSSIRAVGPNGNIKKVNIRGNLDGSLYANVSINGVRVDGDMTGDITAAGNGVERGYTLNKLQVGENFEGSLNVLNGDGGKVQVDGSFGHTDLPGDLLYISGNLKMLSVGSSRSDDMAYLAADVMIGGDLDKLDVVGQIGGSDPLDTDGEIYVGGHMKMLRVAAHDDNVGESLVNQNIIIGGGLDRADFRDGDVGDGMTAWSILVGDTIRQFMISDGDLADMFTVESLAANIDRFMIRSGDLNGWVIADNGDVDRVDVRGSDFTGMIRGVNARSIGFDGSVLGTGVLHFTGMVDRFDVGESVEAGASIEFGGVNRFDIGEHMRGDLVLGYYDRGTRIDIGADWEVTDNTHIDSDVRIDVGGDLTKAIDDALLHLGYHLDDLSVDGMGRIDMIVDGWAERVSFGSLYDSVITVAQGGDRFEVDGAMMNSLLQYGISAGDDGEFAAMAGEEDANETTRMADLDMLDVGTLVDSIVALGGTLGRYAADTMTTSSVSSGLVLGSHAIHAVLDDVTDDIGGDGFTRLEDAAAQNAARSGDDRGLYWGNIEDARVDDGGFVGSYLTAGVDTAIGDFSDAALLNSHTGGTSRIESVSGTTDAATMIVSDATIERNNTTGAGVINDAVTFDTVADFGLVPGDLVGTATGAAPLVLVLPGGATVTITVSGDGSVDVYDDALVLDNIIDALVFSGTTDRTNVDIVGLGLVDIARLLSDDDSTASQVTFDGDLVGDGTDAIDMWIDGAMRSIEFVDLGGDFSGQIGGDVDDITMANQGAGRLKIGGAARQVTIASGTGSPLQSVLGNYAGSTYNTLSIDAAGNLWAHVGDGELHRVDPTMDGPGGILETITLMDAYSGDAPEILGMDFLGVDFYAVARLFDPQPTVEVGTINDGVGVDLRGLAVNAAGQIYTVDSTSGADVLVMINPATGEQSVVGELRNPIGNTSFNQHVLATAFDNDGRLIALVSDRDGEGPFDGSEVALVQIGTTASGGFVQVHEIGNAAQKGVLLDGGGVTDAFTGLAVADDDTIYAIQRIGGVDNLVTIATDGTITNLGAVGGVGATTLKGIGFDQDGNLVALDSDGATARLIYLAAANLGDPSMFEELTTGSSPLNPDLDAFAVGRSGVNFQTYALDTAGDGTFYMNPTDAADAEGRVLVLGTIDTVTSEFHRLLTVSDATGAPQTIPNGQASLPLTADALNDLVQFVTPTDDGGMQLVNYDTIAGSFAVVGPLVDSLGRNVSVDAMDYNAQLIGFDLPQQRLLTIDPMTALVSVRTNGGVISPTLTDLAYNPVTSEYFSFDAGDAENFVQFKGTTEDAAGGIVLRSVDRLDIGSPYNQRIVTTGNSFGRVTLENDFHGTLITAGDFDQVSHEEGEFGGVLVAWRHGSRLQFNGDVTEDARFTFGREVDRFDQRDGDFAGEFSALVANRVALDGSFLAGATFHATQRLEQFDIGGDFAGQAYLAMVERGVQIDGLFDDGAMIQIDGYADQLSFDGGTHANSTLWVGRSLDRLDVVGTHRGQFVVNLNLDRADVETVYGGWLLVGGNGGQLQAREHVTDAKFSYGVQIGEDWTYNTEDDRILGGVLERARFDDFIDSVLVAGVLAPLADGPGMPADNTAFYRTESGAGTIVDNAIEAGGLRKSYIERLDINRVIHTAPMLDANRPVVVTTHGVERLSVRDGEFALTVQTLSDPVGAPTVVNVSQPNPSQIRIEFSESINSDSLRLSETLGDDGTVIVTQDGAIVSQLSSTYTEQTQADGKVRGILTITRGVPFDGAAVSIALDGASDSPIFDRSGLRSVLQHLGIPAGSIADPGGTILDGNSDGREGGNYGLIQLDDTTDDFTLDPETIAIMAGDNVVVGGAFGGVDDVDIIHFTATAGEFFSVSYSGESDAMMGVFQRDDQGTLSELDDTFELLARWESSAGFQADPMLFEAFELPDTGDYYVAVTPYEGVVGDGSYTLKLTLAADNTALAEALGAVLNTDNQISFGPDNVQDIAYVTNAFRVSKQLVYFDFDGGEFTEDSFGDVPVDAFDAAFLDAALAGMTDTLINGDVPSGVTGILENAQTILTSFPAGIGSVDVMQVDGDLSGFMAATTGVYYTTVDPALSGLDPETDFTTVFVGQTQLGEPGLLGLANDIDVAGQNIADQAIVFAENFVGASTADTTVGKLNEYARYFANVLIHELLHTMGLNHQPTNLFDYELDVDDPDNDGNATDSNDGEYGIMANAPADVLLSQLGQLGTARLSFSEFPVGSIDTATLFTRWFS